MDVSKMTQAQKDAALHALLLDRCPEEHKPALMGAAPGSADWTKIIDLLISQGVPFILAIIAAFKG